MEVSILLWINLALSAVALVLGIVNLLRAPKKLDTAQLERRMVEELRASRQEMAQSMRNTAQNQSETQRQLDERQDARLRELREQLSDSQAKLQAAVNVQMAGLDERIGRFAMQNEQKLEQVRKTMEERMAAMQAGNERKLEEMRHTVDEKLQKTLNERLTQSFSLVRDSLDKVQLGLGEMQSLATGVGDLKKVLSNVKTRGILGEIQLGAILEEMLAPEQYAANVATVPGSAERVEFAVKLPGDGEGEVVWLPIDAKFPYDAYAALLDAYDTGNAAEVDSMEKVLETRVRSFAKDIRDKYVQAPYTTDFGIMFLPVEGLYAEVVRRGFVEKLQIDYKIVIAGPTTMAALLNSLQMGFRTLAIQRRSGEVWKVLGEIKAEFGKFSDYLLRTKQHIEQAGKDIEHLIGTRTNVMQRKLKSVTSLHGVQEEEDTVPEIYEPEEKTPLPPQEW